MDRKFIAIVGGIAVGKSTIGQSISGKLPNSRFFQEDTSKNIFLPDFYADMKKWAFHSRISTLAMISSNYIIGENSCQYILMDRCIDELINFAELQYAKKNMNEREYSVYTTLYRNLLSLAHPIDVFIFCHCSPQTSLNRIKTRNREFEQNIDIKYIEDLNNIYGKWVNSLDPHKIARINTDFEMTDNIMDDILSTIQRHGDK